MAVPSELSAELTAIYAKAKDIRSELDALLARLEHLLPPDTTIAHADVPAAPSVSETVTQQAEVQASAPAPLFTGSLILRRGELNEQNELLTPLGLSLEGKPLLQIDTATAADLAQGKLSAESKERLALFKAKEQSEASHFGVVFDVEQNNLQHSRWAIVVNALEDAELIKALWPLIEHRMRGMDQQPPAVDFRPGERAGAWLNRLTDNGTKNLARPWGNVPPVLLYRHGEPVNTWLARHGVYNGPVDPKRGVPFYLLILGRPGPLADNDEVFIPLDFQYELDVFWGVGRVCFTDQAGHHRPKDYTTYAEQVVGFEQAQDAASRLRKEVVYFGTTHELDNPTTRSTNELVLPLTSWHASPDNTPTKAGFAHRTFIGDAATRANLESILTGGADGKASAVLFTAGHGIGLPLSDRRLALHQGAFITQDWSGIGPVSREHWFAGEDLGNSANVEGSMAFLFGCYSVGCPQQDEFIFAEQQKRPHIAPFPLIAQLPQQLLLNGALGVIGHVDRAWSYSFSGVEGAKGQTQAFEDVIGRLLKGYRAGSATDTFNTIQGVRAITLSNELESIKFGKNVDEFMLSQLWVARNDARNYILLGDPAAKLPFA